MLLLGIVIGIIGTYAVSLVVALFLAQLFGRKEQPTTDVEEPAQQWRWN